MTRSLLDEPRGSLQSSVPGCSHAAHDAAFNELIRAAVQVIALSIAEPDTPDLVIRQTGAGLRTAVAARDFALAVDTLPQDERPVGWKPLVPGERLQAALVQLQAEVVELPGNVNWAHPDHTTGYKNGLIRAVEAVSLAIGGGTPESSTAGTDSRFSVCAGEG